MDGEIMIWDIENELHLTTLQGSENQETYDSPKLRNEEKNIIVRHEKGIDCWQLINPEINFEVKEKCSLARMYFLQDNEHIMMVCDDRYFYLIEVDTFKIIREFSMPQGGYLYNLQPNGDVLIAIKNLFYNGEMAKKKKARLPKTYRNIESVLEIESVRNSMEDSDELNPLQKDLRKVFSKNKFYAKINKKKQSKTSLHSSRKDSKQDIISSNNNVAHYHTESEMVDLADQQDKSSEENNVNTNGVKLSLLPKQKKKILKIKQGKDIRVQLINKNLYKYSIARV